MKIRNLNKIEIILIMIEFVFIVYHTILLEKIIKLIE